MTRQCVSEEPWAEVLDGLQHTSPQKQIECVAEIQLQQDVVRRGPTTPTAQAVDDGFSPPLNSNADLFWRKFSNHFVLVAGQQQLPGQPADGVTDSNWPDASSFLANGDQACRGQRFGRSFAQATPGEVAAEASQLQQEALEGPIRLQAAEVLRHEAGNPTGAPRWEGAETFEDLFDREVISHRGWTEVWNGSQGWGVERRQRTVDVGGQRMLFLRHNAGSLTKGPIPDSAEGCPAGAIQQIPGRGLRGAVAPPRGRLTGQVFLDKGSLLACGPAGQASSDNSYGRPRLPPLPTWARAWARR